MTTFASIWGLNAVDLVMAIVIASVLVLGRKDGIITELFKLIGVLFSVFLTLHYYTRFADLLRAQYFEKDSSTEFLAFFLLAVPTLIATAFMSRGWAEILRIKTYEQIDRWGNVVLSLVRGYFLCGFLFLALFLSHHDLAMPTARASLSRALFQNAALGFYKATYSALIEKRFPREMINSHAFDLLNDAQAK